MRQLALVLGGGAAKGYAHIGILKVLEDNGIKPSLIVGTSMGALVGGMYAAGKSVADMKNLALNFNSIGSFDLISTLFKGNLINNSKIKKILNKELGEKTHEDCQTKFVAIAAELNTGKEMRFHTGSLKQSILASIAIPGVFPLVKIGANEYCDGGIVNNLAEDVAHEILPDAVIVSVDVLGDYAKQYEHCKMKTLGAFLNAATLMTTNVIKNHPNIADLRIVISQPKAGQLDFSKQTAEKTIKRGEYHMKKYIKQLKSLLGDKNETDKKPKKTSKTN
ncbi:MAG: patatin-like phospholipase family protein [Clostridia bacterium]|nr:patatin-like phospholipase family protein [Clostridia bacterium]